MKEEFEQKVKKEAEEQRKRNPKLADIQKQTKKRNEESKEKEEELSRDEQLKIIRQNYDLIINVLKDYCDLKEEYYSLIALWIIGTYFHKEFKSYPYIYINAMRGSGKTRLLELISVLSKNGELLASLKEAVLFRTAHESTFCIDEFERISSKEKSELRELLNSAYKKGLKVKRMKKQGETQVIEEFEVYCPIAIANIWGMEEVLGDRCITLILEKSSVDRITKKIEDFEDCANILHIKSNFQCSLCSVVTLKNINQAWNQYINNKYGDESINNTIHIYHITTLTTLKLDSLFNKIDEKNISGRNLELFFPLFIIANIVGEEVLENILNTASGMVEDKKTEEHAESKDVMLIDFVSQQINIDFIPIRNITKDFKEFLKEDDEDSKYTNTKWVGRALRRLNLIMKKRRVSQGVEVILNIEKAKKRMDIFKSVK